MENLAYLHASCAYETSTGHVLASHPDAVPTSCFQGQRFSSVVGFRLLSLLVGLSVLSVVNSAVAATLQKGDSGSEVTALQASLSRLGYFDGPQTGYFGTLTQEALMRFQRDFGLTPDGVWGSQTQSAFEKRLNSIGATTSSIETKVNVADVQRRLQSRGYYTGKVDGIYGSATEAAVVKFQRDFGLAPDGIVGPKTLAALNSNTAIGGDTAGTSTSSGEVTVSEIQQLLRQKGYYDGKIDGIYGPTSRSAVISFQRDNGLKEDGVVGSQTLQALRSSSNSKGFSATPFITSSEAASETSNLKANTTDQKRYLVVVPYRNSQTLSNVQQIVPDAFLAESSRGAFVQAGSFSDRASAEHRTNMLRSQGLDARVD
jgi:peptidoglycan hydrolase-like protein with peptidoglycan-binding domain